MESDESMERRHRAFLEQHQSELTKASQEVYRSRGRGAWLCNVTMAMFNNQPDESATAAYMAASEVAAGECPWPNSVVEEMVNSYNPENQFVIVLEEKSEEGLYDLGVYTLSFAFSTQESDLRLRIVTGKATPQYG